MEVSAPALLRCTGPTKGKAPQLSQVCVVGARPSRYPNTTLARALWSCPPSAPRRSRGLSDRPQPSPLSQGVPPGCRSGTRGDQEGLSKCLLYSFTVLARPHGDATTLGCMCVPALAAQANTTLPRTSPLVAPTTPVQRP